MSLEINALNSKTAGEVKAGSNEILIVDDNINNLKLLRSILTERGYRIRLATSGEMALTSVTSNIPDLILLDITMPGIDGFEVCEKIKNNPLTKAIPIIFLSAMKEEFDIVRGFALGAIDFVTKPFNAEVLLARVNTHLTINQLQNSLKLVNENLETIVETRTAAQQSLLEAKDSLEDTVEHRTRELAETIDLLKQEMHSREEISSELENRNAELERFAYTVSHDLKSPLVTIKGFLGLLGKDLEAGDRERIAIDVEKVNAAADTMAALLNDLLELSRIGQVMGEPEICDLTAIACKIVDMESISIEERGIEIQVDEMPWVSGDAMRLAEVYQNLVENAIKFMGDQASPRIHIGAVEKNGMVCCFVRDNGVGIAEQFHHQVFALFERLSASVDGTGVGLALVRRIVEVHGGEVWVESKGVGEGSCLWFSLPAMEY